MDLNTYPPDRKAHPWLLAKDKPLRVVTDGPLPLYETDSFTLVEGRSPTALWLYAWIEFEPGGRVLPPPECLRIESREAGRERSWVRRVTPGIGLQAWYVPAGLYSVQYQLGVRALARGVGNTSPAPLLYAGATDQDPTATMWELPQLVGTGPAIVRLPRHARYVQASAADYAPPATVTRIDMVDAAVPGATHSLMNSIYQEWPHIRVPVGSFTAISTTGDAGAAWTVRAWA